VIGALDHYSRFLIGRDPMNCGALWQEMYLSQYCEGGRVLTAAIAALDIAFYDLKGKQLGLPVYQLLGGKQRDLVPAFATTSVEPGPEMVDQVLLLKNEGWRCIRMIANGQENIEHFDPRHSIAATILMGQACPRGSGPRGDARR
jgi:galactonate dehydratase